MKKPRCSECGSRRFKKDPLGRVVCEEGHVLQGYTQETTDREWDVTKMKTRKIRKNKAKKIKAPSKYLRGTKAVFLSLELAQLMLRQQIWVLIRKFGFPPELESVVRELWALYLGHLDVPNVPESAEPAKDDEDPDATDKPVSDKVQSDQESGSDTDSSIDVEAAFPPNALQSDQDDEDSEDDQDEAAHQAHLEARKRPLRIWGEPSVSIRRFRPSFTLVVLYLACATLRIPIFVHDLIALVEQEELPYLHFTRTLPVEFQDFITQSVSSALSSKDIPSYLNRAHVERDVSAQINRFVQLYADCDVSFPAINMLPLLWRTVKGLALHPVFYVATKAILRRLNVDFGYEAHPKPGDRVRSRERTKQAKRNNDIHTMMTPDCVLVAAVVFAAKLVYGLDGVERFCESETEAPFGLPNRATWLETLERLDAVPKPHDIAYLRQKPVQDYTEAELDGFLDLAQKHVEASTFSHPYAKHLNVHFPLPDREPQDDSQVEAEMERLLSSLYAAPEATIDLATARKQTLMGDKHPFYLFAAYESMDQHPPDLTRVYQLAGKLIGVDPRVIQYVLRELESRMASGSWRKTWREDELNLEDESEEEEGASATEEDVTDA